MKVKPFYISTKDLSGRDIAEAIDRCIIQGACAHEGVDSVHDKSNFNGLMSACAWKFFGVNNDGDTTFEDEVYMYGDEAGEITLDELDEWLGIEISKSQDKKFQEWNGEGLPPVEWENGDECVINRKATNGEVLSDIGVYYGETTSHYWLLGIGPREGGIYCKSKYWLSKPETPQQREEREREEEIKIIQRDMAFSGSDYCAAKRLYEKGYRKAK